MRSSLLLFLPLFSLVALGLFASPTQGRFERLSAVLNRLRHRHHGHHKDGKRTDVAKSPPPSPSAVAVTPSTFSLIWEPPVDGELTAWNCPEPLPLHSTEDEMLAEVKKHLPTEGPYYASDSAIRKAIREADQATPFLRQGASKSGKKQQPGGGGSGSPRVVVTGGWLLDYGSDILPRNKDRIVIDIPQDTNDASWKSLVAKVVTERFPDFYKMKDEDEPMLDIENLLVSVEVGVYYELRLNHIASGLEKRVFAEASTKEAVLKAVRKSMSTDADVEDGLGNLSSFYHYVVQSCHIDLETRVVRVTTRMELVRERQNGRYKWPENVVKAALA